MKTHHSTVMRRQGIVAAAIALSALALCAPAANAAEKRCAAGLYAGARTSCALAKALLKKTGRDTDQVADGRRVKVRSSVTGKVYSFFLYRADARSFTCRAYGNGVLTVRITT